MDLKRIASLCLSISVLGTLLLSLSEVQAAERPLRNDTTTVFVEPPSLCVDEGDTLVVGVCVDSFARALKVFSIRMNWNPEILEFQICEEDTLMAQGGGTFFWYGVYPDAVNPETVQVDASILGAGLYVNGPGRLFTVTFVAADSGCSPLELEVLWMSDTTSQQMERRSENGCVCADDVIPPEVYLTWPEGGEVLTCGLTYDVTWVAVDNGTVDSISLFYSTNGGVTWVPIATGEENDSTYPWTVPCDISDSCRVRVLGFDACGNVGYATLGEGYFGIVIPVEFVRGDVTADGIVDVMDAVALVQFLHHGAEAPECPDACDWNDDGSIDPSDLSGLLSYLFEGGPGPAGPFPDCGLDLTPDGWGCTSFPPCE
jgi:hypothetical protein